MAQDPSREQWGSRAGFLLAAVGSAVGLGNIWRFPYVAYDSGGGAFIVPYLFALVTAGIPLLVLEYTIGHRYRGSAPLSFRRMHRRAEWIGWWQCGIAFVVSSYYAVVVAWACAYAVFSLGQQWGSQPEPFLYESFLRAAEEPGRLGGPVASVAIPLVAVWTLVLTVLALGVRRGIERANKVVIPLLVAVFLALVVRAVTLPGATAGLDALFRPDWSAVADSGVWVAAYGQVFFSLSVGFAIMVTYASYLPRSSDLTNNAFIAGFSNASFELLAGIGVFAALGFMAAAQGIGVEEVATEGVGLAFVVFPEIISNLPGLRGLTGVLFFGSLVLAGLSSLISVVQTYVAAVQEKFGLSRSRAVAGAGGAAALVSLLYATSSGVYLLDTADYFINHFGIVAAGLVQVVAVVWVLRLSSSLRAHGNATSDIRLGRWWQVALGVVTPAMLAWVLIDTLASTVQETYGGYPAGLVLMAGWGVAAAAVVAGGLLSIGGWRAAVGDQWLMREYEQ